LALSNADREILCMCDIVEAMLERLKDALARTEPNAINDATKMGKGLDQLDEAIKAYIARMETEKLTERDSMRLSDLLNMPSISVQVMWWNADCCRPMTSGVILAPAERDMLERFYERATADSRFASLHCRPRPSALRYVSWIPNAISTSSSGARCPSNRL
jgi:hypothetical protein